jgi:hypothetical protein
MQHAENHCNTLQKEIALKKDMLKEGCISSQTKHCNILQVTATYCNILQKNSTRTIHIQRRKHLLSRKSYCTILQLSKTHATELALKNQNFKKRLISLAKMQHLLPFPSLKL